MKLIVYRGVIIQEAHDLDEDETVKLDEEGLKIQFDNGAGVFIDECMGKYTICIGNNKGVGVRYYASGIHNPELIEVILKNREILREYDIEVVLIEAI